MDSGFFVKENMSAPLGRPPFTNVAETALDDLATAQAAALLELQAEHLEIYEETEILDTHIHGKEHWFGISADQSGNNWGGDTLFPFAAQSGNADYLEAGKAKVVGSTDTPVIPGGLYFDLHRILITGVSENTVFKIRFIWGTGIMVDAITAGQMSEVLIKFDAINPQQSAGIPFAFIMPRLAVGTKVWAQVKSLTNLATIAFYVGLHEYTE